MSKYGDERMHMEDWQDQLQERARKVGPQQAMREMLKVVHDFTDMYWTEQDEAPPPPSRAHCQHHNFTVSEITGKARCDDCGKIAHANYFIGRGR